MSFRKKYSKMTFNYKKDYYLYDYSDIDNEINKYKKAKYIASILSSDNDEMIYYYLKVLKINHIFSLELSINDIINDLHLYSNGNMIDFVFYLL